MLSLHKRQSSGFTCDAGGVGYSCTYGSYFVGCCDGGDACNAKGCSQADLRPASFDAADYPSISNQNCSGDGLWYTCAAIVPTFMGCCTLNPCAHGSCPAANLTAGKLSLDNASGDRGAPHPRSTVTSSSASTTSTTESSNTASTTSTTGSVGTDRHRTSTAAIAGSATGGVVGLIIILALLFYCRRHRSMSQRSRHEEIGQHGVPDSALLQKTQPSPLIELHEPGTDWDRYDPTFAQKAQTQLFMSPASSPPPRYSGNSHAFFGTSTSANLSQELVGSVPMMGDLSRSANRQSAVRSSVVELDGNSRAELEDPETPQLAQPKTPHSTGSRDFGRPADEMHDVPTSSATRVSILPSSI